MKKIQIITILAIWSFMIITYATQDASAQNLTYEFNAPEGFSHTENWVNSWNEFSGSFEQSEWLMEQTAEPSSQLFVDESGKSMVIIQSAHWGTMQDLANSIEEGPEIPSARSIQTSIEVAGEGVILSDWLAVVENTPVKIYCAGFRLEDGTGMRILLISHPNEALDLGNQKMHPGSGAESALGMIYEYANSLASLVASK